MSERDKKQYQAALDSADLFGRDQYVSNGYGEHFHRAVELYGVVKGKVTVKIAGEEQTLTDGQMAIANCMELHGYSIEGRAEVFYLHIGGRYLSTFYSLYKRSLLPRFLMDVEKNIVIQRILAPLVEKKEVPELERHGVTNCLLSAILSAYGLREGKGDPKSHDLIEQVIEFVYEHYREPITLKRLSEVFCIESKTLSKKLSQCLGVDLRVFVNDIRAQKALSMREDPAYRDLPLKEIGRLCGFSSVDTFYRAYKRNDLR